MHRIVHFGHSINWIFSVCESTNAKLNHVDRRADEEEFRQTEKKDEEGTIKNRSANPNQDDHQEKTDDKDVLLALEVNENRAVWMMSDTQWEEICGVCVPRKCPARSVCFGQVAGGIVVTGGWNKDEAKCSSQCHYFSAATKQWKKLSDMITPRASASAVNIDKKKLMVLGGRDDSHKKVAVCEILNVKDDKWTSVAAMPEPLEEALVALAAAKVFILSQIVKDSTCITVYDPSTDTHTQKACLPDNVKSTHGACLVGAKDSVYLFGGEERLALLYNPANDQWINLVPPTAMYLSRYGCCAIVRDKNIQLCGGSAHDSNQDWHDMIEEYNIEKREWKILDTCLPFPYISSCSCVAYLELSESDQETETTQDERTLRAETTKSNGNAEDNPSSEKSSSKTTKPKGFFSNLLRKGKS